MIYGNTTKKFAMYFNKQPWPKVKKCSNDELFN